MLRYKKTFSIYFIIGDDMCFQQPCARIKLAAHFEMAKLESVPEGRSCGLRKKLRRSQLDGCENFFAKRIS